MKEEVKNTMIGIRLEASLKEKFEAKARKEKRKPAEKARMLIEDYTYGKDN